MPATDPVIVVLQLTGGNDYVNTVIPYNNPLYRDNRKAVGIPDNQIMHLDKDYGIPHYMAPIKQFWDDGKLAILHGVIGSGWSRFIQTEALGFRDTGLDVTQHRPDRITLV